MKKIIVLTALFICIIFSVLSVKAAYGIRLYLDGEELESEVSPIIINDRTMVPVRVIFEKLDAKVQWDAKNYQVHIAAPETEIMIQIGSSSATLNGETVTLDAAPVILHDRTLVPIRFISESLGYKVNWDDLTKAVLITSPDVVQKGTKADVYKVIAGDDHTVKVMLSGKVPPRISTVENPFRLVLDFDNTSLSISDGKSTLNNDYITEVRWAFHDSYSRVVIEFKDKPEYKISGEGTGIVTVAVSDDAASDIDETEVEESDDDKIEAEESDDKTETDETEEDEPLYEEDFAILPEFENMLIVIDAGHGGKDTGALARDEEGEIMLDDEGEFLLQEKDVNLAIAQKISDRLEEKGIHVLMTREDDTFTGTNKENLLARCDLANESNATLFISIHNNSSESPKATGTEVCYTEESSGRYGITSKILAGNILPYLVKATGLESRGIINRPNLVVLKNTKMPAVLLECAFMSCEKDRNVLMNEEKLDDIADGVALGILKSMSEMANNNKYKITENKHTN